LYAGYYVKFTIVDLNIPWSLAINDDIGIEKKVFQIHHHISGNDLGNGCGGRQYFQFIAVLLFLFI